MTQFPSKMPSISNFHLTLSPIRMLQRQLLYKTKIMKLFFSLLLILSTSLSSFSQATFNVTATGTDPTIDAAIDFSTDIWGQYLNSTVPVKIKVTYADLTAGGPLAITIPNGEKDFSAAPQDSIWYASCLANSIEGSELNAGEFDMDIYVNSFTNYYFGTDGNPGPGQYDFVSVFMHEIAHGLGILSLTEIEAGEGSFGFVDASNVWPLPISFPFPILEGLPSIWDSYIVNGNGDYLTDQAVFANPSTALAAEFQGNDLFFTGPNSTAANGGTNPKMYATSTYAYGSSLQHFNESSFPLSGGNSMMTPSISVNEVEHAPGSILIGALQDIGWTTNVVGLELSFEIYDYKLSPNPATNILTLNIGQMTDEIYEVHIVDLTGAVISTHKVNSNVLEIDISQLQSGTYLCAVKRESKIEHLKFIKE